jgi:hypothetical protein
MYTPSLVQESSSIQALAKGRARPDASKVLPKRLISIVTQLEACKELKLGRSKNRELEE